MDKAALKKKWENYWYYYKIHTLIGIFILVALIITLQQCATTINPDATVIVVTQGPVLTADQMQDLGQTLAKYTADVNKDGHKSVTVETVNFSDSQTQSAMYQKLEIDLMTDGDILYLTDDASYKQITKNESDIFEKITKVLPDEKLSDSTRLPIGSTSLTGLSYYKQLTGLSFSTRQYSGNLSNKKKAPNIINSLNILKGIAKK